MRALGAEFLDLQLDAIEGGVTHGVLQNYLESRMQRLNPEVTIGHGKDTKVSAAHIFAVFPRPYLGTQ